MSRIFFLCSLVIDELKKWNTSTFLAQHLDTVKIGVFGHS